MAALNWKRFNVTEWFLNNGVNTNLTDQAGNTALRREIGGGLARLNNQRGNLSLFIAK